MSKGNNTNGVLTSTGPISIGGDLTVDAYGPSVIQAAGDITIGGNANIVVETYDNNVQANKSMRSENGSIIVKGNLESVLQFFKPYRTVDMNGSVQDALSSFS